MTSKLKFKFEIVGENVIGYFDGIKKPIKTSIGFLKIHAKLHGFTHKGTCYFIASNLETKVLNLFKAVGLIKEVGNFSYLKKKGVEFPENFKYSKEGNDYHTYYKIVEENK